MPKLREVQLDAGGDNADWIKIGWGWPEIGSEDEMRAHLKARGRTVAEFKRTAAYRLPLKHGTGPAWLSDL